VIPGVISVDSNVGLIDVELPTDAQDGDTSSVTNGADIHAADGIRLGGRHVQAAWAGGVTVQLAVPQGRALIAGVSAAFYTYGTIASDALLDTNVALHINIGNTAKISGYTLSVSGQFATLRSIFRQTTPDPNNSVFLALNGTIPMVFHVDQADQIGSILRLKTEFNIPKVVIIGGAEASVAASALAGQNVPVILSPLRQMPNFFEGLRTTPSGPGILAANNVPVGIAGTDPGWVRNLRWEAAYAIDGGLTYAQALASITSTVAQALDLPAGTGSIVIGTPANFVLYNGDPLSTTSYVKLVALGTQIDCNPLPY